jgi:hypothetical protein
MSGGKWDYVQFRLRDSLREIGNGIFMECPKIGQILLDLSSELEDTIHKLDYHYSGDSHISNFKDFEKNFIKRMGDIIKKKLKVRVYEIKE